MPPPPPAGAPARLSTAFDIRAWYAQVRVSGRPVAWCSAFAPAEVLLACGVIPVYPENHAAMLGALSPVRDPDRPYARAAIDAASREGLAAPRLCSYALADLGTLHGEASPIGGLPEPDLFYACDSQCAVVARWGEEVRRHFAQRGERPREIPHFVLRAPPLTRAERHTAAELAGFREQLVAHAHAIAALAGTSWREEALSGVLAESAAANRRWQACLTLGEERPAPWTSFDAFTAMAPIVIARGTPTATAFYSALEAELRGRRAQGVAAVPGERVRLLWDAIPIWPRKNWLAQFFASRGAAVVTSTYTHSWWFSFDTTRPLEAVVERYAWNTMNRSGAWVLDWTLGLARRAGVQGVVAHWNRSCGIWNSYVKRRLPGLAAAGMPTVVLEADMVDPRAFDAAVVTERLERFLDQLAQAPAPALPG